ncbi:OprD family outer membrane porin [Sulfurospirillum multivorans]|uniref:Outer membrane porin n=2 Tax=Sulfurospirillum multivorans TaxID=66821 RepID=A0AA86AMI0_SULMK|nr:OprD family outer membrane porin [Sulfurospirillum multivorans]AHJ12193.1 outer membrane porin [Sulfurospirillum multivorans DSM 12446]QEH05693.1 outer membrane porin [Sulfurospirillum multivorans]
MKLVKLSLVAFVVAGLASSSFAASDTLADAFKNGKVNGELRAWYFDRDTGDQNTNTLAKGDADIFSTGVMLSYVTDSLYGLSLGTTFQSSYSPFADNDAKNLYGTDMYGSGAVLSEAYVTYTLGKTTAKVGRQFIASPLVNSSGSRMIKEAFQAAVLINTDLPDTTLVAGYSDRFQGRTSDYDRSVDGSDSEMPSFKKEAVFYGTGTTAGSNVFGFDGAYTAAAINKSITNLTLTGQYLFVNDVEFTEGGDANVFYAEGNYVVPLSTMKLLFDVTYRGSRTSNETFDSFHVEGDMYQGRIGFSELAGFKASFAYSTVSDDQSVLLGAGNGPSTYTAPLIKGAEVTSGANTNAYKVEVGYDFSKVGVAGLKVLGQYAKINQDAHTAGALATVLNGVAVDTESTYWEAQIAYDLPTIKGLTLSLEYEDGQKETTTTVDSSEMRFRANYKF